MSSGGTVKKACERCTRVKAACDAARPQCGRCTRIGVTDCTYRPALRRGRKAVDSGATEINGDDSSGCCAPLTVSTATPRGLSSFPSDPNLSSSFSPHPCPVACLTIAPSPEETAWVAAFFATGGEMASYISQSRFLAALRQVQEPSSPSSAAQGGAPLSQADKLGLLLLFHVLCGLGASAQQDREAARDYLHKALGQLSACSLQPCEFSLAAFSLLSFALMFAHGPLSQQHLMLSSQAVAMVHVLASYGTPSRVCLATAVLSNHALYTRKAGSRYTCALPDLAHVKALDDMLDAISAGRLDLIPAPTGEAPAPALSLMMLVHTEKLYGFKGRQLPPGTSVVDAATALAACADHLAKYMAWSMQVGVHSAAATPLPGLSLSLQAGIGLSAAHEVAHCPFDAVPATAIKRHLQSLAFVQVMARLLAGIQIPVKVLLDCSAAISSIHSSGVRLAEIGRLLEVVHRVGLDMTLSLVTEPLQAQFLLMLQQAAKYNARVALDDLPPSPLDSVARMLHAACEPAALSSRGSTPVSGGSSPADGSSGSRHKRKRSSCDESMGSSSTNMLVQTFFTELEYGKAWRGAVCDGALAWQMLEAQVEQRARALSREPLLGVPAGAGAASQDLPSLDLFMGVTDYGLPPSVLSMKASAPVAASRSSTVTSSWSSVFAPGPAQVGGMTAESGLQRVCSTDIPAEGSTNSHSLLHSSRPDSPGTDHAIHVDTLGSEGVMYNLSLGLHGPSVHGLGGPGIW